MSNWLIALIIYCVGAVLTGLFNIVTLTSITYPLSILRNAILWPLVLPRLFTDWLADE